MGYRMTLRRFGIALLAAGATALPAVAQATEPRRTVTLGPAPTTKPQLDVLQRALASLDGAVQHRMRIDGTVSVSYRQPQSQLTVSMSDQFAGIVQVESPTRSTMSIADARYGPIMSAIMRDGAGYVGSVYDPYVQLGRLDAATLATWIEPRRQVVRPRDTTYLREIRQLANENSSDGTLLHFRAELSPNYTRNVVRALTVDPSAPKAPDVTGALEYVPGTIDVFTTEDGRLVREVVDVSARVKPGQTGLLWSLFEQRIGSGEVSLSATFTPSDFGEPVEVVAPYVPRADRRSQFDVTALMLLISAGSAADTYAKVTGNYEGLNIPALSRIEPSIRWIKKRPARAIRSEVRLDSVARDRVVMSTRTPDKREFTMRQPLTGSVDISCKTRKGKTCEIGIFAKIASRMSGRIKPATRRLHFNGRG